MTMGNNEDLTDTEMADSENRNAGLGAGMSSSVSTTGCLKKR